MTTARPFHLLTIDTATHEAVVATEDKDGRGVHVRWRVDQSHGERLLPSIQRLLDGARLGLGELTGIVVGLGPGSFTGLRIGLATAKGLALGLGIPIVGIPTVLALAWADAGPPHARRSAVVLQPAGPSARYRTLIETDAAGELRFAGTIIIRPDEDPDVPHGARLLAIDLPDAPFRAQLAGEKARLDLGAILGAFGAVRLVAGGSDDLAGLVPVYVSPPRGAAAGIEEMTWSPDPR
jgi:tRNA threonylcarbamoyl adenosine modification protein YeaZ